MKKKLYNFLSLLPLNLIKFIAILVPKRYRNMLINIQIDKFVKKTDFKKLDVSHFQHCLIIRGTWDYPLFHMYFINNMMANILYCLSNNYLPKIEVINSDGVDLWNQFLKQPYEEYQVDSENIDNICDLKQAPFYFPNFPNRDDIHLYSPIFQYFVNINKKTLKYFDLEYQNILKRKGRVIGVLCRGTDYTANKPKGHPIQPEIEDVIELVKEKMKEYKCQYIYLATDEKKIKEQFEDSFSGKIIENKRKYYDQFYKIKDENGSKTRISWVHFERDNDNYYKSLEYFSSINLLSKCNLLIAGNCGGSRMALYLNNEKYEYYHLFNLGEYQ